jgi:hypothetical protein
MDSGIPVNACTIISEKYQKVLLVMEKTLASPEIVFDTIASTSGVETIEKARKSKRSNGNEKPNESDGGA